MGCVPSLRRPSGAAWGQRSGQRCPEHASRHWPGHLQGTVRQSTAWSLSPAPFRCPGWVIGSPCSPGSALAARCRREHTALWPQKRASKLVPELAGKHQNQAQGTGLLLSAHPAERRRHVSHLLWHGTGTGTGLCWPPRSAWSGQCGRLARRALPPQVN